MAQAARRGAAARVRAKTNMHTYRTFGNMLGMVFVHSFDRSVRVYEAMILRGFSGRFSVRGRFPGHIPRCRVRRGGVRVHGLPRGL